MQFWSRNLCLVNAKKFLFLLSPGSCEGQTSARSVHIERVPVWAESSSTTNITEPGRFPCAEWPADPDRKNWGTKTKSTFLPLLEALCWCESGECFAVCFLRLTFTRSVVMTTGVAVTCSWRPDLLMRITIPSQGEDSRWKRLNMDVLTEINNDVFRDKDYSKMLGSTSTFRCLLSETTYYSLILAGVSMNLMITVRVMCVPFSKKCSEWNCTGYWVVFTT